MTKHLTSASRLFSFLSSKQVNPLFHGDRRNRFAWKSILHPLHYCWLIEVLGFGAQSWLHIVIKPVCQAVIGCKSIFFLWLEIRARIYAFVVEFSQIRCNSLGFFQRYGRITANAEALLLPRPTVSILKHDNAFWGYSGTQSIDVWYFWWAKIWFTMNGTQFCVADSHDNFWYTQKNDIGTRLVLNITCTISTNKYQFLTISGKKRQ